MIQYNTARPWAARRPQDREGCVIDTIKTACRRTAALALAAALCLALCLALPARAAGYDDTLQSLERLQGLAEQYAGQGGTQQTAQDLAIGYTRIGRHNSLIWQLTAGVPEAGFESFVQEQAPELIALRDVGPVQMPNGEQVDINHLVAGIQLVCKGMPIVGSWGGDCVLLAQGYTGQGSDVEACMGQMGDPFAAEGSPFGQADLLADLDAVILGAQMQPGDPLAPRLQGYYTADLTDHDRAYQFIALSFGSVDTADQEAFRQTVWQTLTVDAGMQLMLYIYGLWQKEGWQLDPAAEPALRAACNLFADRLAQAVGYEKVRSDGSTRMVTMAGEALASALASLGDTEAAEAALAAQGEAAGLDTAGGRPLFALPDAPGTAAVRAVLWAVFGAALAGLALCLALLAVDLRRHPPRRRRHRRRA